MINTSKELYINMNPKDIPLDKDSSEYRPFWKAEKEKCKYGLNINGVYISGWLYWHTNHWKITDDRWYVKNGRRFNERIIKTPDFRDNEWKIAEAFTRGEEEQLAVGIVGLRQMGKTQAIASYSTYSAIFNRNSQNIIVGGSGTDLSGITDSIDFGMTNCSKYFRMTRLTKNWKEDEVYLGIKKSNNDNIVWSNFRIRNTREGKNTEAVAGSTIKSLIFDEIGKHDFLSVYEAAKPALLSSEGWRCAPILMGTGGSFEKGRDAEVFFFNPTANDAIAYYDEFTKTSTGLFMSGHYRQDCKYDSNLGDYLGKDDPDLKKIKIKVSDWEKAEQTIRLEREQAKTKLDEQYLKQIMYYPLKVEEVFLSDTGNVFPKELIQKQLEALTALEAEAPLYSTVELERTPDNRVIHRFTDDKPISKWPIKAGENPRGAVQIWEFPIESRGQLYVAGMDPYKQSKAQYSDSIGSLYIFKRIYDVTSDKFQDMIVACYNGRPGNITEWRETCKDLLRFYNAKALCENEDYNFIQHCIDKNVADFYLERSPLLLINKIHKYSNVAANRKYGLHATSGIRNYMISLILDYLKEEIAYEYAEDGTVISTKLGVSRILDKMLLKELLAYNPKEGNYDRIVAFALALASKENKSSVKATIEITDNREKAYWAKRNNSVLLKPSKPFISINK